MQLVCICMSERGEERDEKERDTEGGGEGGKAWVKEEEGYRGDRNGSWGGRIQGYGWQGEGRGEGTTE